MKLVVSLVLDAKSSTESLKFKMCTVIQRSMVRGHSACNRNECRVITWG